MGEPRHSIYTAPSPSNRTERPSMSQPRLCVAKRTRGVLCRTKSEARVFLLAPRVGVGFSIAEDSYRGFFRLLTEQHIPFAAVENLDWLGKREADLVIAPGVAPKALEAFVRAGGRLIIAGSTAPEFEVASHRHALEGSGWRLFPHSR